MTTPYRAALVLALAAGAGAAAVLAARALDDRPVRNRVAVSVFANRTGDPTLDPLGSMAADWITRGLDQLEQVDAVEVAALHAQGRGEGGEPVDPVVLARRNGAGTVVSGSYYLATDTLVLRASLVDAATGTVLQTVPPVHAPAADAVRALDQMRQRVAAALAGTLDVRFASFSVRPPAPRNFAAYQAFIEGQTAYWQARPSDEVRVLFQRAAEADSTFLTAAVWLAFVGANGAGCGLTDSVATALEPRRASLTEFDRLTLDISAAKCRNDWDRGYALAREQAALRPRSTYAVYTAGAFALFSGRFRAAVDLLASIDPDRDLGWLTDPAKLIYWRDYAGAAHLTGAYRSELRHAERLVATFPDRGMARYFAARALAALGRGREALAQLEIALHLPHDPSARMIVGVSPGYIAMLLAGELRVHGDTAAARIAAARGAEWFRTQPREALTGRYERFHWARCLAMLERYDEAAAVVAFRAAADSADPLYLGLEGALAAHRGAAGRAEEADARLAALQDSPLAALAASYRARLAAVRGERERALELLDHALGLGLPRVPAGNDLHLDFMLDSLRGDPRFERIVRGKD